MRTGITWVALLLLLLPGISVAQQYKLAVLKYGGGGDWYSNPTSVPNLVKFANQELKTGMAADVDVVEPSSPDIFNYPFIHMTGHGNVLFNSQDVQQLRTYLLGGGFLHIDDNYGMDPFIRRELKKVFPEYQLTEIPPSHPIFKQKFSFPNGLPKIHEHDDKTPQAFGLFHEGRMIALYTYECDLGDGWEDPEVHNDSEESRLKALRMGANILQYVFMANFPK